nr:MAG TPA: hypothetical protein [Caudoviricetes sp.]
MQGEIAVFVPSDSIAGSPSQKHNISPKIYAIFLENYTIDF